MAESLQKTPLAGKTKLIVMVGLPASGKTTFAKEKFKNSPIISSDDIRKESSKDKKEPWGKFYKRIYNAIVSGEHKFVVADATNLSKERIYSALSISKATECDVNFFLMKTSLEECTERNKNRENKVPHIAIVTALKQLKALITWMEDEHPYLKSVFYNISPNTKKELNERISKYGVPEQEKNQVVGNRLELEEEAEKQNIKHLNFL